MRLVIAFLLGAALTACAGKIEEQVVELLESGKFSEAQEVARKSGAKGVELVRINAFVFHGAGIADSSLKYLDVAVKGGEKDPRVMLRMAEALVWKKNLAKARSIVEAGAVKDILKEPRPWESSMRRASLYVFLQDLPKARQAFLALASDPKSPTTYVVTAKVYLAQLAAWNKEFAQCVAITDSVLVISPGNVQASLIKGQVFEWQGKYAEARSAYTASLQKYPDNWQLRERLEKLSWVK
jgi:tetratricopeptide (TPR) repeat protein